MAIVESRSTRKPNRAEAGKNQRKWQDTYLNPLNDPERGSEDLLSFTAERKLP